MILLETVMRRHGPADPFLQGQRRGFPESAWWHRISLDHRWRSVRYATKAGGRLSDRSTGLDTAHPARPNAAEVAHIAHDVFDAPRARRLLELFDGHARRAREAARGLVSARRDERNRQASEVPEEAPELRVPRHQLRRWRPPDPQKNGRKTTPAAIAISHVTLKAESREEDLHPIFGICRNAPSLCRRVCDPRRVDRAKTYQGFSCARISPPGFTAV